MSEAVRQFGRVCEVVIGAGGAGLKVTDLRIQFEVVKTPHRTPNAAEIKIFNLNQDHENAIKREFDEVLVNVGYAGHARMILRGNIRRVRSYRDQQTERIVQIIAGDGDADFRKGTVNFTLAAGSSHGEVVDHIVGKSFRNTKKGHVVTSGAKRLRGRVYSGMARDVLDDIAMESDAHWSIQDGVLQIVPVDSTLPNEAVKLTYDTGLLEAPEVDTKGIAFKCLLNPELRVNGKVWLDNNELREKVSTAASKVPVTSGHGSSHSLPKKPKGIARLDPDGVYKLIKVVHKGDTHGDEWFTEGLCVALGKSIPAGKAAA